MKLCTQKIKANLARAFAAAMVVVLGVSAQAAEVDIRFRVGQTNDVITATGGDGNPRWWCAVSTGGTKDVTEAFFVDPMPATNFMSHTCEVGHQFYFKGLKAGTQTWTIYRCAAGANGEIPDISNIPDTRPYPGESSKSWQPSADTYKVTVDPAEVVTPDVTAFFVWDGNVKTGVVEKTGYKVSGDAFAKDRGTYTATATLEPGYVWPTGSFDPTNITWSIGNATDAVASIGDGRQFQTLQAAYEAAADGDTVKVLKDIVLSERVTVAKNLTVDLNGFSLKRDNVEAVQWGYVFVVDNAAVTFTLKDTSEEKTGSVTGCLNAWRGAAIWVWHGTFVLESGSVYGNTYVSTEETTEFVACGGAVFVDEGAKAIVKDGAVVTKNTAKPDEEGGKKLAFGGAFGVLGRLEIEGGVFSNNVATTTGGVAYVIGNGSVYISGGLFVNNFAAGQKDTFGKEATATIAITNGTFDVDPTDYLVPMRAAHFEAGLYTVVDAVVYNQTTRRYYESLAAAVAKASANDELQLVADADLASAVGKALKLDLNGKKLALDGAVAISENVEIVNSVAGQGGLENKAAISVAKDKTLDMSSLTWGAGGFVPQGNAGHFNIASNAVVKMGSPDQASPNRMNKNYPGFIAAEDTAQMILGGTTWEYGNGIWGKGGKAVCKLLVDGVTEGYSDFSEALGLAKVGDQKTADTVEVIDTTADTTPYGSWRKDIYVTKAASLDVAKIPARYGWQGNVKLWPFVAVETPAAVKYRDVEPEDVPYEVTTNDVVLTLATAPAETLIYSNDQIQVVYTIDTAKHEKWRFADGSTVWTNAFDWTTAETTDPVVLGHPDVPMEYMPYYVGEVRHECYVWTNVLDVLKLESDRSCKYIDGDAEMWVVVRESIDESIKPVEIRGNVHLIVQDNVSVTFAPRDSEAPGLALADEASLEVYAQSLSFDMGTFEVAGNDYADGILGEAAAFAVNSGYVAVSGDWAGIDCGSLAVRGGTLYADGADGVYANEVTVTGGELYATGLYAGLTATEVTLDGGYLDITGGESDALYVWDTLTVESGTLLATCYVGFSGIYADKVVVNGGEVLAVGNDDGVGIDCATAEVNGGSVTVYGSNAKSGIFASKSLFFDVENASFSDGYMSTLPTGTATKEDVKNALKSFADAKVKNNVTNVVDYNAFVGQWAMQVNGGTCAVEQNAHAWVSYKLGVRDLFVNAPSAKWTETRVLGTGADMYMYARAIVMDGDVRRTVDPAGLAYFIVKTYDWETWEPISPSDVMTKDRDSTVECHIMTGGANAMGIKLDFNR